MSELTSSDVALLSGRNNDMFNGEGMMFWVFALLLLNNNGFGGFGGNYGGLVSQADLAASQNAQTQQLQMNGISDQIANTRFDLSQAISNQTSELMINAIQGFNNVSGQITNQTNVISNQIQQLNAKLDQCCCEIKTQMLQDRLQDTQAKLVTAQNAIDNANQSQYILSQLGRFVAWTPSGSQAATTS